jgi:ParB family chromosome partitioning protein
VTDESLLGGSRPRSGGRKALGRGLDALMPAGSTTGLREVDIDSIDPNPNQPRQRFERKALEDLAASIAEHGVVQPLVVSKLSGERYRLVVGERRWQAARIAGLRSVPVIIKETTGLQTLELALIENLQRADLNPLEEAAGYQRLMQDFGITQQDVAGRVGKSRAAVANTVRLLALPESLKRALVEEKITEGHARALLMLPDQRLQLAMLERIERTGLSVRQTEQQIRRLLEPLRVAGQSRDPDVEAVETRLRQALGTKVTVRHGRRGGRIVIEYYSSEELEGLFRRLVGEGLSTET